jgi:hypothetical protein
VVEIPNLGLARYGEQIQEDRYLVVDAATKVEARPVPQRRGGVLYAVDHIANPSAIWFRPGGLFQEHCLIGGEILGVGNAESLALYRPFSRAVMAGFEKIKRFYAGPEASRLLHSGARLTLSAASPAEYDLRPDVARDPAPRLTFNGPRLTVEQTWDHLEAGAPRLLGTSVTGRPSRTTRPVMTM